MPARFDSRFAMLCDLTHAQKRVDALRGKFALLRRLDDHRLAHAFLEDAVAGGKDAGTRGLQTIVHAHNAVVVFDSERGKRTEQAALSDGADDRIDVLHELASRNRFKAAVRVERRAHEL